MKYAAVFLGLVTYGSLSASIYTMNDSASARWGVFGILNVFLTWIVGMVSLES